MYRKKFHQDFAYIFCRDETLLTAGYYQAGVYHPWGANQVHNYLFVLQRVIPFIFICLLYMEPKPCSTQSLLACVGYFTKSAKLCNVSFGLIHSKRIDR